jgi:hypothetical protein
VKKPTKLDVGALEMNVYTEEPTTNGVTFDEEETYYSEIKPSKDDPTSDYSTTTDASSQYSLSNK